MDMHTQHTEKKMSDEEQLMFPTTKKTPRTRKWREIEEIKARQHLMRELKNIDQSFDFSLSELQ